jgi:hypothetical protein
MRKAAFANLRAGYVKGWLSLYSLVFEKYQQ